MRQITQYNQAVLKRPESQDQGWLWLSSLRRILVSLGVIGLAGLIAFGSVLVYRWIDGPVLVVAIATPLKRVNQIEFEAISSAAIKGGFLSLDLDALCAALEAHPWIAEVTVRRYWPDRIEISVREEVAIARWGESGFLNQRGQILQIDDTSDLTSLPLLSGPEGSVQQVMREYRDISELLLAQGLRVNEFEMDKYQRIRLHLNSGFSVWLGRHQVLAKVRRFLQAWASELKVRQQEIRLIDARYENGVAVSWR